MESKIKGSDKTTKKRPTAVAKLFTHVCTHWSVGRSERLEDSVLRTTFKLAIESGMKFTLDDVAYVCKLYGVRLGMSGDSREAWYADAVKADNTSACRSFEAFLKRPAFIYETKRLYVGARFIWDSLDVSVTSFDEDHAGHFLRCVTYKTRSPNVKIEKRLTVHLSQLKEGAKASAVPKPHPDVVAALKWFSRDVLVCERIRALVRKSKTLKEAWEAYPYHSPQDLCRVLLAFKYEVPYHVANAWRTADEVRVHVGDFDVTLLPLFRKEVVARREAACKAKKEKALEAE